MPGDTAPSARPDPDHCPVETTLSVIAGRWKPFVFYHLRSRPRRFNELRRRMPKVTQRMLTQTLRELEAAGLVSRTVEAVVPPRVTYALTEQGRSLFPILDAMADWGAVADTGASTAAAESQVAA
jgi:DNA-binding HxlR family transcriptional regulator